MAHRISREKSMQLQQQEEERKHLISEGKQPSSIKEKKKFEHEEQKKSWFQKMKERGGLRPRKAKCWGDDCNITNCPKWIDGSCQYPERDTGKCYMEEKK